MTEAFWRSLKHGWLYLHQLDTFPALEKLITFFVEQHNALVPHSAFAATDQVFPIERLRPAPLASSGEDACHRTAHDGG
jgi:hypothetical protein